MIQVTERVAKSAKNNKINKNNIGLNMPIFISYKMILNIGIAPHYSFIILFQPILWHNINKN
jgi:hypothetical protein